MQIYIQQKDALSGLKDNSFNWKNTYKNYLKQT